MIQRPREGEYIVGVPPAGPLLGYHTMLKRHFRGMLAAGREVEQDGARCIEWIVDGKSPVESTDPRHGHLVSTLRNQANRAGQLAAEIQEILDAQPRAERIRIDDRVADILGLQASAERIDRDQLRLFADVMRLASKSVLHALRNPVVYADERGASLANWGVLPGRDPLILKVQPVTVSLERISAAGAADDEPCWEVAWRTGGAPELIELQLLHGAGDVELLESCPIDNPEASGTWRLPHSRVPPGSKVRAVATGRAGSASADLQLGTQPLPEPAPVPPARPYVPPARATPSEEPELVLAEEPDSGIPGWLRWLLWALALLGLLSLLWLLWNMLPVPHGAAARDRTMFVDVSTGEMPPRRPDSLPPGAIDVPLAPLPADDRPLIFFEVPGRASP